MKKFNEVKTRNELADFLNIPRKQLSYHLYIKGINNSYTSFEIKKKNGGIRKIHAPSEELKGIQRKLVRGLSTFMIDKWKKKNISHGFQKNKGIITNANIHRNKWLVWNIDIENFFESIHFGRVRGFFEKNNNFSLSTEIATVIAQISCYDGKLPQGAPSSPIISNLICEILDNRISKIAKKYKLDYTRYADDLTFSTNDKNIRNMQIGFYKEISNELTKAGFKINEKKNRLQLRDSRQVVTGLVVNKKINVNRIFYKQTRAMANQLYKQGSFEINGEPATLNQLEGRFAFINQLCWYNNNLTDEKKFIFQLSSRERQYQRFLFYKYFFANSKPLIVTEGKTDVVYLKSALKSLYKDYPDLITKNSDGTFEYKVSFLKKTKRLAYFLGVFKDGGSGLNNIYSFYSFYDNKNKISYNYSKDFKKLSNKLAEKPVILIFDNEIKSKKSKPIGSFLGKAKANLSDEKILTLERQYMINIIDNLFLVTIPLIAEKSECDIEDLFNESTLLHEIEGREFSKASDYDVSKYYGKEIFSQYVSKYRSEIDFKGFRPLLDNINNIVNKYPGTIVNEGSEIQNAIENSNTNKTPVNIGT
jgi:RNA-directed DNA polymerase